MRTLRDNLYWLFERHLFNVDVECDESKNEFVEKVVAEYWRNFRSKGVIQEKFVEEIREDLKAEVYQMLQKKTYGHFSLTAFRKYYSKKNC